MQGALCYWGRWRWSGSLYKCLPRYCRSRAVSCDLSCMRTHVADGSIAMVHTGINASERLLKFVLECRRKRSLVHSQRAISSRVQLTGTVSCEILLQKHCSWAHICSSVIKHMVNTPYFITLMSPSLRCLLFTKGLPVKDIDSFMIVDEDGEIDTRNIGFVA